MSIYNSTMKRNTRQCNKCGKYISLSNYNKHINSKKSCTNKVSGICRHCGIHETEVQGNFQSHVKYCENNPKRKHNLSLLSDARRSITRESRARANSKISQAHRDGRYALAQAKAVETKRICGTLRHSQETKEKLSILARQSNHQRVCKSTHEFVDKQGRTFKFDSKWEDAVAIRLDELDVKWDRPLPIEYELGGKIRKYFADFYLPDYDLYLDPKNKYCREVQKEKLEIVSRKINLIIISSLEECKNISLDELARLKGF